MRLGLLSDSHDRVPAIAEFARHFADEGIELILHAGDFCSPFSLRPLRDAQIPLGGVFGHNDGDRGGLRAESSRGVGMELYESPHSVEVGGRRILLVHDLADVQQRSLDEHALVIHGCSHRQESRTQGNTLLVNPGEACGWLYGPPSAAIVDLESLEVDFLSLDAAEWCR